MQVSWVLDTLTLIFGLISSLQGASGNEVSKTLCPVSAFPCQEFTKPLAIRNFFLLALIVFWVIFALLCICGLVMSNCKGLQHDLRPADNQSPPNRPSKAPQESIWVTSVDPLPTIHKLGLSVVLNSTGTETRPPYSLRPEGLTVQMRGTRYATLSPTSHTKILEAAKDYGMTAYPILSIVL
uniref:Uncharacterized protein n=1 Tax=Rattus norvegicus TaxID=10116 RepID=A0A8I6A358_RAT